MHISHNNTLDDDDDSGTQEREATTVSISLCFLCRKTTAAAAMEVYVDLMHRTMRLRHYLPYSIIFSAAAAGGMPCRRAHTQRERVIE
jgi:hypothetical protein